MLYDKEIVGKFVTLRSITLNDVEFSYQIRSEGKNKDTVGQLAASLEEQQKFIEWQIVQPDDYYFVVLNRKGERIGLIGVYDIHDGIGELGREVNDGLPEEAMEAELLIEEFVIEVLKLNKLIYVVYCNNKKQLNISKRMGVEPLKYVTRNGIKCLYYEIVLQDEKFLIAKNKREDLLNNIARIRGL